MTAADGSPPRRRIPPPPNDAPDELDHGKRDPDPPGPIAKGDHLRGTPAWRRVTAGEKRFPAALAAAIAIGLQVALPNQLTLMSGFCYRASRLHCC